MSTKKIVLLVGTFLAVIFGPIFLLCTPMIGCYQRQIDANPNSESSKNWQLRLAKLCTWTFRPEHAAEMYGKFVERNPEDERRPDALWMQAMSYENAERRKEAIDVLCRLYREHPGTPRARQADERLTAYYKHYQRY